MVVFSGIDFCSAYNHRNSPHMSIVNFVLIRLNDECEEESDAILLDNAEEPPNKKMKTVRCRVIGKDFCDDINTATPITLYSLNQAPLKEIAERNKRYFDPARIEDEVKMSLAKVTHQDILNVIMKNREVDRKRAKLSNQYFLTPKKTTLAELERAKNQQRKKFKEEAKYRLEALFLQDNQEYLKICTVSKNECFFI